MNPSKIIQGLMRLDNLTADDLYNLITFDLSNGINYFDISDIYMNGEAEIKLGQVFKKHPDLREKMYIQTKCGIVKEGDATYYDLSYEHIVNSVENSLKRMNIDYIDALLLHRPDIFLNAGEVAQAFAFLSQQGKVKKFGVSNFPHEIMKYLYDNTNIPIDINQLQLGLGHMNLIREVFNVNMDNKEGVEHTGELFFYMKRYGITLQCWSPYQVGFFGGSIFNSDLMKEVSLYCDELANKYKVSKCAIATAFLLKLDDEHIQVITGSTNPEHVKESVDGTKINLTKAEWYTLYKKAGNFLP